jgi:fido (protein-threonine AMPylation protein)
MSDLDKKLAKIDCLKTELDKLRPLSDDTEKELKIRFENATIYNSNLGKCCDTKEREILEIAHKEALNYIVELSRKNTIELNKADILKIHFILFKNICPKFAGKYRCCGEAWVSLKNEEKHKVCDPLLIPDEMNKFFDWLFSKKNDHPLIIAAEAHNKFVTIHPFFDGKGGARVPVIFGK